MRTNKFRRWLLRGAIVASAAAASVGIGEAAHADIIWSSVPAAAAAAEAPPAHDVVHVLESDIIWS
jgi:hypothetical protein